MITLDTGTIIDVPMSVAVCPCCGRPLSVQTTSWTQDTDGSWYATGMDIDCEMESDIDSDEWEEWIAQHTNMPYVYMLPVQQRVERWLKKHYRFKCGEARCQRNL